MHDIEPLIANWRAKLSRTVSNAETIRELEAHLRDHIEALMRSGVPASTAFAQATRRLGEPDAIEREFSRARSRWRPESAAEWILVLLVLAVALVSGLLASGFASGKTTLLIATHVFAVMTGYLTVFASGLIGACALLQTLRRRLTETERHALRRTLFRLTLVSTTCLPVGIGLGMIWAARHLGSAWSWAPVEIGAAFVLLSSLLLFVAQLRRMPDSVRYVLAVSGAVVLAIGWVGARAVTAAVPIVWLCGALAVAQIAVLLLRSPAERNPTAE